MIIINYEITNFYFITKAKIKINFFLILFLKIYLKYTFDFNLYIKFK